MIIPRTLIISGVGLNCEEETLFALQSVGFIVDVLHLSVLLDTPKVIHNYQMFVIPGGFSYGDELGSGTVMSIKIQRYLKIEFEKFILNDNLVLGICNGCQVLVKLLFNQDVLLKSNTSNLYQCEWQLIKVIEETEACKIWYKNIKNGYLPIAHGEGKFVFNDRVLEDMYEKNMIVMKYDFDCNGSEDQIAAVTSHNGRVLLTMPHPERAFSDFSNKCFFSDKYKDKIIKDSNTVSDFRVGSNILRNAFDYFI